MADTFEIIRNNLTRLYVFYAPESAFHILENSIFKGTVPLDAYNSMAYFDVKGTVSTNIEALTLIQMFGKEELLKKNTYTLFEYKKNYDQQYFKVLLDDYLQFVEAHVFVTKWMYQNITKVFYGIQEKTVMLFKIQMGYFESHYKEVYNHFKIQGKSVSIANEDIVNLLKQALNTTELKSVDLDKNDSSTVSIEDSKATTNKKHVISDEEIDYFLLASVFNVKL